MIAPVLTQLFCEGLLTKEKSFGRAGGGLGVPPICTMHHEIFYIFFLTCKKQKAPPRE